MGGDEGIAQYSMETHQWRGVDPLDALTGFVQSAGRLWAHTFTATDLGSLYVLDRDNRRWIGPKVSRIKPNALDPAPAGVLAVTADDHVILATAERTSSFVEPSDLTHGLSPTRAAVVEGGNVDTLYLGFEDHAARFDLRRLQWTEIPNPGNRGIERLFANRAGLWLQDDRQRLFLLDSRVQGPSDAQRAEGVREVDWDEESVLVRTATGHVERLTAAGKTSIIGDAFPADLQAGTRAVAQLGHDLFAASGSRVGWYRLSDHSWTDVTPGGAVDIEQIVATKTYLYVRDSAGSLFRFDVPMTGKSSRINGLLQALCGQPGIAFGVDPASARVSWIGRLADGLGVIVPGIGTFALPDDAPASPRWVIAQSQGPPGDARITCAGEIGRALYLGTSDGTIWASVPVVVADNPDPIPFAWQHLTLDGSAVQKIAPIPDDDHRLAVMTTSASGCSPATGPDHGRPNGERSADKHRDL